VLKQRVIVASPLQRGVHAWHEQGATTSHGRRCHQLRFRFSTVGFCRCVAAEVDGQRDARSNPASSQELFVMAMQPNQGKPQQSSAKPGNPASGNPGQQRPQQPMNKPGQQSQQRPGDRKK
jgi:hypothetical protein